jgi:hypothetical protein
LRLPCAQALLGPRGNAQNNKEMDYVP